MIFTVPWRCMLIILLLAFLQSLAQQEGWGPGNASSSSLWLETSQRGFGLPRPFPSLSVCWWVLPATSAAVNVGHPSTSHWDSQVCWKQEWMKLPVAGTMLSAPKCHSQWDAQRHRGAQCIQKYQNNNLCSNHWTLIPLTPSSSSSHPHSAHRNCPRALPGYFSGTLCTAKHLETLAVFPAMWRMGFWTAELDDWRRLNVLKL